MLGKDIEKILVDEAEILLIAKRLGKEITNDYRGKKPLIIGLLKGCVPFLSELIKHINLYLEIDFMGVASYQGGVSSSGNVKITKDLDTPVVGRDVIITEDIVNTGNTIDIIKRLLIHRGAASVEVVTLLDKPLGREIPFQPKYVGTTIPKEFVVGFGLDYDEMYRNLPYVGVLKQKVYKKS